MQLGGYCEVCSRWVWVNGWGGCQYGHPASAVHEVQPLTPRSEEGRVPASDQRMRVAGPNGTLESTGAGSTSVAPVTPGVRGAVAVPGSPTSGTPSAAARSYVHSSQLRKRSGGRWWWRHSLWIALTFTFGLFNWLAFLYIGVRARRWQWLLASLLYLLPIALTVASVGSGHLGLAIGLQLFMSGVSVLHAFVARPRYRSIMFGDPPSGAAPSPPPVMLRSARPGLPRGLDDDVAAAIRGAQALIDQIAATAEAVEKPNVRRKASLLCQTAEEILAELRNDPGQVPLARPFLGYYLEAANRILRGYVDLSSRGFDSPDTRATLTRAEASLDSIQLAFDSQLASLLQRQVLDLDSEIALLERTVQMDTLMNMPALSSDPVSKTEGA
jgi:hypothetical protein